MKHAIFMSAMVLSAGICTSAWSGSDNTALQKEIMEARAKEINNPGIIGPASIVTGAANPAVTRKGSDNTVIVGRPQPPSGDFLPMFYRTSYDGPVCSLIFAGLLKTDRNGEFIPDIAEAMPEISADHKTYTVKLKKGVKFSDGSPLTAKDVAFTYRLIADPAYSGNMSFYADNLEGYSDFKNSKTKEFEGVKAVDDNTVQFKFKVPKVTNITYLNMGILPESYYKHECGDLKPVTDKIRQPLGSGPYKLAKFEPRQYAELTVNDNYFGTKPAVKNIIIQYVNPNVSAQALINGDIDILPVEMKPDVIEAVNKTGYINRTQYLRHGFNYVVVNNNDPVLKDGKVRRALLYGLDRTAFLELALKGLAIRIDTVCAMTWWMYDKDFDSKLEHYQYNPDKAKTLLDEAGWKMESDGFRHKDGKKLELIMAATENLDILDVLIPILLQNWQELGVDVKIKKLDFNSLINLLNKERTGYSIAYLGISELAMPDPRQLWHSSQIKSGGGNFYMYSSKKCDELIEKIETDFDKEQYKKDWQDWILYMNSEEPTLPLFSNIMTDLYNNRIKNYSVSSMFPWNYELPELSIDNGKK